MKVSSHGKKTAEFNGRQLRERLEEIKDRIGHGTSAKTIKGMDRRVSYAIREARPDLQTVSEDTVTVLVKVTLDQLMQDAVAAAGLDPKVMEYEYSVTVDGKTIVVTGESEFRSKSERPHNKKELEASIKRQVSLAFQRLFESSNIPVPVNFINRTVDSIGSEVTRLYLDKRISSETIETVSARLKK